MIELKDLSIGYPSGTVVDKINATLNYGQLIGLVGINGAGKSTLLKTIAGFIPPLSGNISISSNNRSLRLITELTEREKSMILGVVLTSHEHYGMLTVYDVVSLGRTPYTGLWGSLTDQDNRIIEYAISLVGVERYRDKYIDELSDGERQKVMIAKVLAQQTPVIILDEPSAFLDYPSKEDLMCLLLRLAHEQHKAILLSSHDLDIIRRFVDGFWIMEKESGKILLRMSPGY